MTAALVAINSEGAFGAETGEGAFSEGVVGAGFYVKVCAFGRVEMGERVFVELAPVDEEFCEDQVFLVQVNVVVGFA